jgi:hypothetical protein
MPEAEYQKLFKDVCHESPEEPVRKAIEAAKAGGCGLWQTAPP